MRIVDENLTWTITNISPLFRPYPENTGKGLSRQLTWVSCFPDTYKLGFAFSDARMATVNRTIEKGRE